jgi:two-component system alkaline phosphatase synthesis response regulator PhoP
MNMQQKIKILLVDDELDVLEILQYILRKENFETITASNGKIALEKARDFKPDLILLDRMMPVMDGVEACRLFRKDELYNNTKIVFLSARGEENAQIEGLDAGADDYISKPIKSKYLLSKIKSLMRLTSFSSVETPASILSYKDIILDKERYIVIQNGVEKTLPKKEFELLSLLISKPDKVFRREFIMSSVWGSDVIIGDRTIDVHVRKLREKLGEHCFATVKGIGYKFVAY